MDHLDRIAQQLVLRRPDLLGDNPIVGRAVVLVRKDHVTHLGGMAFQVKSATSDEVYEVTLPKTKMEEASCTCPHRQKAQVCKHIVSCYIWVLERMK